MINTMSIVTGTREGECIIKSVVSLSIEPRSGTRNVIKDDKSQVGQTHKQVLMFKKYKIRYN